MTEGRKDMDFTLSDEDRAMFAEVDRQSRERSEAAQRHYEDLAQAALNAPQPDLPPDAPGPYQDLPWLTKNRLEAVLEQVREWGADQWRYYEGEGADWDTIISDLESEDEPYPTDWEHPLMKKIKREYGKARREANEI